MKELAAYFQAYRNIRATEETIKAFLTYATGPVYLLSDKGDSEGLRQLSNKYNCIFEESPVNISTKDWKSVEQAEEWLTRVERACKSFWCKDCMILEDDVTIRGSLQTLQVPENGMTGFMPDIDINTARLTERELAFMSRYVSFPNGKFKFWTGCGGSCFSVRGFLSAVSRTKSILKADWNSLLRETEGKIGFSDYLLTMLFLWNRAEVVHSPLMTEVWVPGWKGSECPVVHQYKKFYDLQTLPEHQRGFRYI